MPGGAWAGTDPLSAAVQAVFQKSSKAVVKVEAEDDNGQLSGTGFFIDPNGTVYTNYSVGGESRDIVISDGAARYPATRVAADPRSGLAILKIDAQKTPFLPLGKSTSLSVASMVVAIGYPLDLPLTPNFGCVGGFGISDGNRFFAVSHIRANVPVQRGEGGAPLLNMDGEVVGILESSLDGGAGCFVLPIEAAEKVQSDVMRFGEVRPGWLGIRYDREDGADSPIVVQGFIAGSPAEKSGIQPGDAITRIGDHKVTCVDDILNAAFYLTAGDEVPISVTRNGQPQQYKVTAGPNPDAPDEESNPGPVFNLSVRLGK
ncbi:MAG TPA: trypsin-like peptidase domain-containing protein [Chthoniobacteraceae bacterium]|jgi:serine protease Do|nr:trypsin-like peptidase domain-containing protein [Chthoniobacteraceae bacterium]